MSCALPNVDEETLDTNIHVSDVKEKSTLSKKKTCVSKLGTRKKIADPKNKEDISLDVFHTKEALTESKINTNENTSLTNPEKDKTSKKSVTTKKVNKSKNKNATSESNKSIKNTKPLTFDTMIKNYESILYDQADAGVSHETQKEFKSSENLEEHNGVVNEFKINESSKKSKIKTKDKLDVGVKDTPKRNAKRKIIKKIEEPKDIVDEENITEPQTENVLKENGSPISEQHEEDTSALEKKDNRNVSIRNISDEANDQNDEKLLAILEEYKIENLNEYFDYQERDSTYRIEETETNIKQKSRTILCGLLREDSFEIQKSHCFGKGTLPKATSVFNTNGNSKEAYKVTPLPKVDRKGKNCPRNCIIKSFAEKIHYTKGPDIDEKSANIPQILKRLADRKRAEKEEKLVKKKPIPRTTEMCRRKFLSHIFTIRQVIEKCRIYNQTLYLAFNVYEGERDANRTANEVDKSNSTRSKNDYFSSYNSSKTLDTVLQTMNWCERGINVNGAVLTHLRFDEYIVLFSPTEENMRNMLDELHRASELANLRINLNKTQIMSTEKSENSDYIKVSDIHIPLVAEHVHLGQVLTLDNHQKREMERRIELSKERFDKIKNCFQNMSLSSKKELFEKYILSVMTDGAQTWTITKQHIQKLRRVQLAMERVVLDIPAEKKISNGDIRIRSGFTDVGNVICSLKWKWITELVCRKEERDFKLLYQVLNWSPDVPRRKGRPPTRWSKDVEVTAGISWRRMKREEWRLLEGKYVKHWTSWSADSDQLVD